MRMKKSEKELLDAVNDNNQVLILEKLAVIFTEDAIEYSKKSRSLKGEYDSEKYEDLQDKKMKNLLNLQKVNADILRLQDKYQGEKPEPEDGSEEANVKKVINNIPQI